MNLTLMIALWIVAHGALAGRPLNIYLEDGNTYLELGPHPVMETHTLGDPSIFNDYCFIDQPRIVSSSHVYLGQAEDHCGNANCKDLAILYIGLWTIMIAKPSLGSSTLKITYFIDNWYKYHQVEYTYDLFKDCDIDQMNFLPIFNKNSTNIELSSPPAFIIVNNCGSRFALRIKTTVYSDTQKEVSAVQLSMPSEVSGASNPLFSGTSEGALLSAHGDTFYLLQDRSSKKVLTSSSRITSLCSTRDGWVFTTSENKVFWANLDPKSDQNNRWNDKLKDLQTFAWREAGHGNCILTAEGKTDKRQQAFYLSGEKNLSDTVLEHIKRSEIDEKPRGYIDLLKFIVVLYEKTIEVVFKNAIGSGSKKLGKFDGKFLGVAHQHRSTITGLMPLVIRSWKGNDPVDKEDNSTTMKLHFEQIHLTNALFSCENKHKSFRENQELKMEVMTSRMNYTVKINLIDLSSYSESEYNFRIIMMVIFFILIGVVVAGALIFLRFFNKGQKKSIKIAEDMVKQSDIRPYRPQTTPSYIDPDQKQDKADPDVEFPEEPVSYAEEED